MVAAVVDTGSQRVLAARVLHAAAPVPGAVSLARTDVAGAGPQVSGGGGLKLPKFHVGGVNVGRMVMFAALGAAAAAVIPPLAVLGGPVGGAIVGALISLVV